MGEQACCVLCPNLGDKTSEAFDWVSQHSKQLSGGCRSLNHWDVPMVVAPRRLRGQT